MIRDIVFMAGGLGLLCALAIAQPDVVSRCVERSFIHDRDVYTVEVGEASVVCSDVVGYLCTMGLKEKRCFCTFEDGHAELCTR